MQSQIGFVLLTHSNPAQSQRLVRTLNTVFDEPKIACHHDFSKCPLERTEFPSNLQFVDDYVETAWGDFSLVEGTLRALRLLYAQDPKPDWFIVLSGADYPLKRGEEVLADFESGGADAYIDAEWVQDPTNQSEWADTCRMRYMGVRVKIPSLRPRDEWTKLTSIYPSILPRLLLPYSDRFQCYGGSQWFSGNRKAAEAIFAFDARDRKFRRHCNRIQFADETYFQTVLGNAPGITMSEKYFRYLDWVNKGPHPKVVDLGDLEKIVASGDHFVRKCHPEASHTLMAALDARLGISPAG